MKRGLRKFLKWSALIAGAISAVLAAAVLILVFDKPLVKKAAQRFVFKKTGIELTIGRLDYRLFPLSVEAAAVKASYATPVYSLEATIRSLGARGDLIKLLRGEILALETVEADIQEIRVAQARRSPVPIDLERLALELGNLAGRSRRISLRSDRLIVLLLDTDLRADDAALEISAGAGGPLEVALDCANITAVRNLGQMTFGSRLEAAGRLTLGLTVGFDLRLALTGPRIDHAGRTASLDGLTSSLRGTWEPGASALHVPEWSVDAPGLASLRGNLSWERGERPDLEAAVKGVLSDLEALGQAAGPFLPPQYRRVRFRGKADLEARYAYHADREIGRETIAARLRTSGVEWGTRGLGLPLSGRLSGDLEVNGDPADPQFSGDVRLESGKLSSKTISFQKSSAHVRFAGSRSAVKFTVPAATLDGVSIAVPEARALAFEQIRLSGNSVARTGKRPLIDIDLEARLPGLAPIRASGRGGLAPERLYRARLESTGQQVPAIRDLLEPFLPRKLGSWEAGGTVDAVLELEAAGLTDGGFGWRADLNLHGGSFNDPGFTVASEGLRTHIIFNGDHRPGTRDFSGTMTIEIIQGGSLWKNSYISWDKSPLRLEASGRYVSASRTWEELSAKAAVPGVGELQAVGRLGLAAPLTLDLKTNSRFALEPAVGILMEGHSSARDRPRISGEAASELDLKKTEVGFRLKGWLTLGKVSLKDPASGLEIPSLSARLPLDLTLAGQAAPAPDGPAVETGTLSIGEVRTPNFTLHVPPLPVKGLPGAFEIGPLALEVFGGRLETGKITLSVRAVPFSLQGAAALRLSGVDLSRLPFLPSGSGFKGTARADFPVLDIAADRLRAEGQAVAEVFGGQVIITDLAVDAPFAAGRKIFCEVELRGLDLKQITDLVPFGEVTGIIRGEVRNLVIAYGQPEQFTLTLESVDRKGVPRTFSLKAVNSLTVIAAGGPAASGTASFWLSFLKGFRYDRIGIRSTLKNDTFTIEGTIKENGVEYLVKRPALFGIDVVNRNPGRTVGFKDMMNRLNRVGQSGAPDAK